MKRMLFALGAALFAAATGAFEKIAYIDSFDYPALQETETAEGSRRILDNVLKTGATTVLWRNQSGAVPRYPSAEEALPLKEPPLDKRRIPLSEPVRGWVRFDDCGTNLIHRAADVTLKEGRRLVLCPRETPLTRTHLKNMLAAQEAGAVIMPFMPAFYGGELPLAIEIMMRYFAGRLLDQLRIPHELIPRWRDDG